MIQIYNSKTRTFTVIGKRIQVFSNVSLHETEALLFKAKLKDSFGDSNMMKYIPDSMSYPFTVWMSESGFYPSYKKGYIVMKRGKEVAKISLIETKKVLK